MAFAEWLNEFTVNTTDSDGVQNDQFDQQVIQLANGNILVAWTSRADVGVGVPNFNDVIGRIFDPFGNLVKSEFRINLFDSDNEQRVSLSALPDGGFMAAFATFDPSLATPRYGIRVAVFDADGIREREIEIKAPSATDEWKGAKVAALNDSNAMIIYTLDDADTYGQRFNPQTGALLGGEFLIADLSAFDDNGTDMVALPLLPFYAVVYADADPTNDQLHFTAYTDQGVELAGGGFVIADSASDIYDPSITALDNGKLVVTWSVGNDDGIRFSIIDALLSDSGPILNPVTSDNGTEHSPEVVDLGNGEFLIAWYETGGHDIRAQRFDDSGNKIGPEETIVSYNTSEAFGIEMTLLEDGRISVSWMVSDGSNQDIKMAIWDPRDGANTVPAYDEGAIIGTPGNDEINPIPEGTNSVYGVGGNDTFWVTPTTDGTLFGTDFDGGTGTDTLGLLTAGNYDARQSILTSLETLKFNAGSNAGLRQIYLDDSQAEMFATYDFSQGGSARPDEVVVFVGSVGVDGFVDLSGKTLVDFESGFDLFKFYGSTGNDVLGGTQGDDWMNGGLGDDGFVGGTGIDTVDMALSYSQSTVVDLDAGTIVSNGVTETLFEFENVNGSHLTDIITGNEQDNELRGNLGADTLDGGDGQDQLFGGSGNDKLIINDGDALFGPEVFDGGTGTDELRVQGGSGTPNHDLQDDTLTSIETLKFGSIAAGGDRTIILSASQFGSGLSSTGKITGLNALNSTEVLRVNMGTATALDLSSLTFVAWGNQGEFVDIIGDGDAEVISGSTSDDVITGSGGDDVIDGGEGRDTINGGADNDLLRGGNAIDTLNGGFGDDTIQGGLGTDIMDGGNDNDTLDLTVGYTFGATVDLGAGTVVSNNVTETAVNFENVSGTVFADTIFGATSAAILLGFDGDDTLTGGAGDDEIDGSEDNDIIEGGAGGDDLDGGNDTDTLSYAGSSTAVTVDIGLNTASGGDADGDTITGFERIIGSDFADFLTGSGIANLLTGGLADDRLTGGGGSDTFRFEQIADSTVALRDRVVDFVQGADRIDLRAIDADDITIGNNDFVLTAGNGTGAFTGLGQVRYAQSGVNTTISINTTGDSTPDMQIILVGLYTLTAADFIL